MKIKLIYIMLLSFFVISCSTSKTGTKMTFDRNIQPKPGPAPIINLGKPNTFTLDNGLKVLVVENHKLPRVSATLSIDNKPLFEGKKAGVSSLLGALLGSGTQSISKDDFNEKVDYLGAYISYGSRSARMSSLSKFFPEVFALMADGALHPVFTKDEFDKEVNQFIDGIKSGEKSIKNIASRVENVLTFGKNHPYGEFASIKSVKNIKLQDVKDLYNTYYKPNNAYLVIVGDVKFEEVKKLTNQFFNKWKVGQLPEYKMPEVKNVSQTEIDFIDMPNASQTQVSVISTTHLKMDNPDYHAVLVANQIFGGNFNSYLNMNLREAHGYTYGARSSLRPSKYISKFQSGAQVRNEVADSTVVEIFKEFHKIYTEKVSTENLKNIKASYAGRFVMAVEKPETVARYALNIEKNNLPKDFYETYLQKINAVTIDDVQRVVKKYFNKDNARIVVTSKGADVIPALEKLGYPIHYFDKEGNKIEKPEMKKEVPKGITPTSVLENYIKAIGGKNQLESVVSIDQTYQMKMSGMSLIQKMKTQKPNLSDMRVINENGVVTFRMVYDGNEAYMEQMGSKQMIFGEQLEKMKAKKGLFEEIYLMTNKDQQLSLDGIVSLDGKDTYKMIIKDKKSLKEKYFEVESGLLVKEIEIQQKHGKTINMPTYFNDYKEVKGVLFPYTIKTEAMGQEVTMLLTDIEINKL